MEKFGDEWVKWWIQKCLCPDTKSKWIGHSTGESGTSSTTKGRIKSIGRNHGIREGVVFVGEDTTTAIGSIVNSNGFCTGMRGCGDGCVDSGRCTVETFDGICPLLHGWMEDLSTQRICF